MSELKVGESSASRGGERRSLKEAPAVGLSFPGHELGNAARAAATEQGSAVYRPKSRLSSPLLDSPWSELPKTL